MAIEFVNTEDVKVTAVTFVLVNPVDDTADPLEVLPHAIGLACTQCPYNIKDFAPRLTPGTVTVAESEQGADEEDGETPLFRLPRLPSSGYRRLETVGSTTELSTNQGDDRTTLLGRPGGE